MNELDIKQYDPSADVEEVEIEYSHETWTWPDPGLEWLGRNPARMVVADAHNTRYVRPTIEPGDRILVLWTEEAPRPGIGVTLCEDGRRGFCRVDARAVVSGFVLGILREL